MSLVSSPPLGCSAIPHAHTIVKFATSSVWKIDFAKMAARFENHKNNIELDLQMYTGITVANVNITLTSVDAKITAMKAMMEIVFDKMQSFEEKELAEFVWRNGGTEGLLENSELKKKLFEKEKKRATDEMGPSTMPETLDEFEQELEKNVQTVLEENRKSFEKRFEEFKLLLQETKGTIRHESDRVIQEVSARIQAGPHEQIIDKVHCLACSWGYVLANFKFIRFRTSTTYGRRWCAC